MILSFIFKNLFSPIGRVLAAVSGVLLFIWQIYRKGAEMERMKIENKSLKETQDAIKKAEEARNASNRQSDRGGLLADDGYRRD